MGRIGKVLIVGYRIGTTCIAEVLAHKLSDKTQMVVLYKDTKTDVLEPIDLPIEKLKIETLNTFNREYKSL